MDIGKLNASERLNEWAQMISQCRNSGITVKSWCAQHGISTKTYYYRLKRLCEAIPETATVRPALPQNEMGPVFTEITSSGRRLIIDAAITVRLGNAEIAIRNGADPSIIEAAMSALSRIC
jgi:hypothetical protein